MPFSAQGSFNCDGSLNW